MNIAVACGGTGGHIFPGLATAEELLRRGHAVTLWLAGRGTESAAVSAWQGPVVRLAASGFDTRLTVRALGTAWSLWKAGAEGRRRMRESRPDVLLGMGSYASVGPILAALRSKVPVVLHEANVVPGRAIRLFARRAAAVGISFEGTSFYLKKAKLVQTGMPIRRELEVAAGAMPPRAFTADSCTVLVMGGSAGAQRLNREVPPALADVARAMPGLRIIHLAGRAGEEETRALYARAGVSADVSAFTHDMAEIYVQTDFAICRSGAATCAELSAFGAPSLLTPYPHAVANHQWANAQEMEKDGAADLVADADLTAAWLVEYLHARLRDPERRARMSRAARARAEYSGASRLADLVERTST
ncbi:MAG TPA: UDP-N-acetylglucosamine--N-acetylmuramyl-(pentapeptide) pyrophosphoryl-undecaprenol N-acetylglucosamine transferase [Kiritimatiellia bacterium]|nr:UDP-N-acetylglucosamine--N-acetylmuramyl-(pentapeptide) pyrophosphoryl-undecaprenol N-acetylglucosamine transferase [Kiritimatiellia bacterium]